VWFYLYKLIWPLNLCFVYPRWAIDGGRWQSFVPDIVLLTLLLVTWRHRQSWGRGPFMVLSCYVALLLPVLGFANIYFMRYSLVADHWQYAAMIVPAAGMGALFATGARRGTQGIVIAAVVVVLLAGLGTLTYAQTRIYQDTETLWRAVFTCNPDSWMPHHDLGNLLANRRQAEEAVEQYKAAVRLKPDDFQAYNNMGVMLRSLGREQEAIEMFRKALWIKPDYGLARRNLGLP
jgi:tetratricopeptide (TPR) repeat protein